MPPRVPYNKRDRGNKPSPDTVGVCRDHQRGRCTYGTRCRMKHIAKDEEVSAIGIRNDSGVPPALLCLVIEKYNMYRPDTLSLDLTALGEYEEVRYHMAGQHPFDLNTLQGAECLASVIVKKFPSVIHLSLRKNGLTDPCNVLAALAAAGHTSLATLTLTHNPIADVKFAPLLKPFRGLQALNVSDCPCYATDRQVEARASLAREVPWLLSVDGTCMTTPHIAVPWFVRPPPISETSVEARVLECFYDSLGTRDPTIGQWYAPTAVLSISVLPTCKIDAPKTTGAMSLQVVKNYARVSQRIQLQSHNLTRCRSVADVERCSSTLLQGREDIAAFLLSAFCPTEEDGVGMAHKRDTVVVVPITASQVMVCVTGSLVVTAPLQGGVMGMAPPRVKHFDRTFIISSPDGLITNDTWNIRNAVADSATWTPVSMGARAQRALQQYGDLTPEIVRECLEGSVTDRMFHAMVEVVARTRLRVATARSLLESVPDWDVSAALVSFATAKDSLTPEHFY